MDPYVWAPLSESLRVLADDYVRSLWRHHELCAIARERLQGLDGWVTPTVSILPPPVAEAVGRSLVKALLKEVPEARPDQQLSLQARMA